MKFVLDLFLDVPDTVYHAITSQCDTLLNVSSQEEDDTSSFQAADPEDAFNEINYDKGN